MKFRQLRYFVALAETLHFRKAADRLHITQPPLSRAISQLEATLGFKLFRRDRRQVQLTDGGRLLLPHATALLDHFDRVMETVSLANGGKAGSLRIGIGFALAENIQHIVVKHADRFPGVDIQCADIFSTYQIRALLEREVDVGFLRPPVESRFLASELLFQENFVVVVPRSSPWAAYPSLRLHQIADKILLLPKRAQSIGMHDKIVDMYRRAGLRPRIKHTATLPQEAGSLLVAAGKGIYVVPAPLAKIPNFGDALLGVPLNEPEALIDVHMSWRKDETSPLVLNFLNTARRIFPQSRSKRRIKVAAVSTLRD